MHSRRQLLTHFKVLKGKSQPRILTSLKISFRIKEKCQVLKKAKSELTRNFKRSYSDPRGLISRRDTDPHEDTEDAKKVSIWITVTTYYY